jgi:hypothetical protein
LGFATGFRFTVVVGVSWSRYPARSGPEKTIERTTEGRTGPKASAQLARARRTAAADTFMIKLLKTVVMDLLVMCDVFRGTAGYALKEQINVLFWCDVHVRNHTLAFALSTSSPFIDFFNDVHLEMTQVIRARDPRRSFGSDPYEQHRRHFLVMTTGV